MNTDLGIAESTKAAEACMRELASDLLGVEDCALLRVQPDLPEEVHGAHLDLIDGASTLQIGVFSSRTGVSALTRTLLQLDDGDNDPSEEDIADAVGEIVNVLAGAMKEKFGERDTEIRMGLPVFVRGKVDTDEDATTQALDLNVGGVDVTLTLVLGAKA